MMVYYTTSVILCLLSILYFAYAINSRERCTSEGLLDVKSEAEQFMISMLSPLPVEYFFENYFEKSPIAIRQRPHGFYEGLLNLNTIGDFLKSRQIDDKDEATMRSVFKNNIKHGGDWKLVKRVWKNGHWWTTSPNLTTMPLEVVYASFERKGYSIVIDKIQEFHPPLKMATDFLESLFGCLVNANMYLTPHGVHQAFDSHFDWMDGIIVQVMGCKKWKVYTSPTAIRPLPDTVYKLNDTRDQNLENQRKGGNFNDAFETFDLRSGSLLYIPRGFSHEAATNCSNSNEIHDKTKRSNEGNVNNDKSTSESGTGEITANVASLHITFGLEVATDSTVEIFLHHYILVYFDMIDTVHITKSTDSSIDLCGNKFSDSSEYSKADIDGLSRVEGTEESAVYESNDNYVINEKNIGADSTMNSSDFVVDMENTTISLQNGSHKLDFRIDHLTNIDLIHLIIHVASTINSKAIKKKYTYQNYRRNANDDEEEKLDEINKDNELELDGSSILRQAVAITTFTAKNKYQPMLCEILPEALIYLKDFFAFYSMDFIITEALLLAFRMNLIDANIQKIIIDCDGHNTDMNCNEECSLISETGEIKCLNDVSNLHMENKNNNKMTKRQSDPSKLPEYIKYFLSSSENSMIKKINPAHKEIRNICEKPNETINENLNASERQNIQDFNWKLINPKTSVYLKFFSKLKSIIEKILISLHDYDIGSKDTWTETHNKVKIESEKEFCDQLYCAAWGNMTTKLKNEQLSRSWSEKYSTV